MNHLFRPACLGLVLALVALSAGCGPKTNVTLAPVSGKVTVGGQPITSGQVALVPEKGQETTGLSAGKIESDGSYTIYTGGKAGAPIGKYNVTVTPSMTQPGAGGPGMGFNARYMDPAKSGLHFDVKSDAPPGTYDLKLDK